MGEETLDEMREKSLLSILSENFEALYYVDFDLNIIRPYRMNKAIEERFGDYLKSQPGYEDAMTNYIMSVVDSVDREEMLKRAKPEFLRKKLKNKRTHAYDFRVTRNGEQLYYRFKISNLDGVGELHKAVVGFANVTSEMDRINQLMESKAMLGILEYDQLTGLYSREFFFKKVEEYIREHQEEDLLLWTSDVQGLKVINEKYGIDKGDEVLKIMAASGNKFPGFLFGGRIEGDKFSALMTDEHADFNMVNSLLISGAKADFPVPNVVIKHGVYHIKKNDTLNVQGMYDRTILALNSIKDKYGYNVAEYDDRLRKDLIMNRQIVEEAQAALENNEFKVYFQPKVFTKNGAVGGAEALVRWIHPELGFMNPGLFISLFEQNGFITSLDFFIWEEVCRSLAEWKKRGLPLVTVSVNVSRRDFEVPDLADRIIELVDRYGVDHSLFQIEITESSFSDNPDIIKQTISKLHKNGFSIALDDFGTGYSSMIALSSLDLDVMKLDMSLIQNDVPGSDKNVLEFSMQLAKMMKLQTVTEGVETDGQAQRIKMLGGDYIQGYYYSKPLSKDEFEKYITQ